MSTLGSLPEAEEDSRFSKISTGVTTTMLSLVVAGLLSTYAAIWDKESKQFDAREEAKRIRAEEAQQKEEAAKRLPAEYEMATHAYFQLPYAHGKDARSQQILTAMWQEMPAHAKDGFDFQVEGRITASMNSLENEDAQAYAIRLQKAFEEALQNKTSVKFARASRKKGHVNDYAFVMETDVPLSMIERPMWDAKHQHVAMNTSSFHVAVSDVLVFVVNNNRLTHIIDKGNMIPFDQNIPSIYKNELVELLQK